MSAVIVNGSATGHNFTGTIGSSVAATFSYNCPAGTNCLVITEGSNSGSPAAPSAISFNGVALTLVTGSFESDSPGDQVSIWYLVNPPTGTSYTVSITYTQSVAGGCAVSLIPLENVNTSSPVGTAAKNALAQTGVSVSQTGGTSVDLYIGALCVDAVDTVTTTGTSQTNLVQTSSRGSIITAVDSQLGTATGGVAWTISAVNWWAASAVAFKGVSASGPTVVQSVSGQWPNGSNMTLSLTGVTANNSILVASMVQVFQVSGTPTVSVTDGTGYTDLFQNTTVSITSYHAIVDFALLQNVSAGTHSIVCTTSAGNTNGYGYSVAVEIANLVNPCFDVSVQNNGTSANSIVTGTSAVPQFANEISFAAFAMYNNTLNITPSEPSGYTNLVINGNHSTNICSCSLDYLTPLGSTSPLSATWGSVANNNWIAALITLSGTALTYSPALLGQICL